MGNPEIDSEGTKRWYDDDGELHRDDGPAVHIYNRYKAWYRHGKKHRIGGPAIYQEGKIKEWWVNGVLHRLDGAAIEYDDGGREYYIDGKQYTEGQYYRKIGLADQIIEIDRNGTKRYYNDKEEFHRIDEPAIEYRDGGKGWFIEGIQYTEEEYNEKVKEYEQSNN